MHRLSWRGEGGGGISFIDRSLDALDRINQRIAAEVGDSETVTRIAQYEMAYRMQASATDAFDIKQESAATHAMYGTEPGKESFANNCLLARRLAERGVRYIQLFHWGWDAHGASAGEALNSGFNDRCKEVDQSMTALLKDKVSLHDLQATMMHPMGFDHERFTYPAGGVPQRLTNITKPGTKVIAELLA